MNDIDGAVPRLSRADLEAFRHEVRRFVAREVLPHVDRIEAEGCLPDDVAAAIRTAGYVGMRMPAAYGGQGLSLRQYCLVLEEFACAGPGVYGVLNDMLGLVIHRRGTDAQRHHYLPRFARGELRGAIAITEPEAGSDAAAIRTRAVRESNGWRVNGRKHYISGGDSADFFMTAVVTDPQKRAHGGITAFLIDRTTPGFSVTRVDTTMGSSAQKLAELAFQDCLLPDSAVLGEVGQGFQTMMSTLDDGRLGVSSFCVGITRYLLDLMVQHAGLRSTFGKKLATRQAIQWMIADSAVELELGRALLYQTLDRMEEGESVGTAASMCKVHCTEMVNRVADRAVQIHGGMGVVRGFPIERLYREVRFFRIGEGASEVQRMIIARALLGPVARDS